MLRCLAADDEPLALELLEDNISQVPFLKQVGRCRNAFEVLEFLQTQEVDLLFLDIQMPGLTGVQLLKTLNPRPMVIFVTAYQHFALDGFDLDVVDYLMKPVDFERFLKAANKAYELHQLRQKTPESPNLAPPEPDALFVHADYALVRIGLNDITYIESEKDYLQIHTSTSHKPVITRMSLKAMEEKLPNHRFMRVHKSYIVALEKIESVRNARLSIGSALIPLSDSYSEAFFNRIGLS